MESKDYFRELNLPQPTLTGICRQWLIRNHDKMMVLDATTGDLSNQVYDKNNDSRSYAIDTYHPPMQQLIKASPLLRHIHRAFPFSWAHVFSMDPNSAIHLHADPTRNVAINMLIDGYDSNSLFFKGRNFVELVYKPHTLFVYNTSTPHMVLNYSTHRYMLTMHFKNSVGDNNCAREDVRPNYADIIEYLDSKNSLI